MTKKITVQLPDDMPLPDFEVERYEFRRATRGETFWDVMSSKWVAIFGDSTYERLIAIPAKPKLDIPAAVKQHGLPLVATLENGTKLFVERDIRLLDPSEPYRYQCRDKDGVQEQYTECGQYYRDGRDDDRNIASVEPPRNLD